MAEQGRTGTRFRVACIGECMIELSRPDGQAGFGVAGDTFNSAVHLARLLPPDRFSVSYLTRLGVDPISYIILSRIVDECVDTSLVGRDDNRMPGIYAITVDSAGERSFTYWRSQSAARTLFSKGRPVPDDLADFDAIFLSAITLAIIAPEARSSLMAACRAARHDGRIVAFDSNFRPSLWESREAALRNIGLMWDAATIGLPSHDDETLLHPGETPDDTVRRIAARGVCEVAMKNGAEGPLLWPPVRRRPRFAPAERAVDTTGAGDAFNAGYMSARLQGLDRTRAALAGHELALRTIAHPGAILPREGDPA